MPKAKQAKHLKHPESIEFITVSYKPGEYKGISKTPCLMQAKGNKPVKNNKYIFNVSPAE